MMLNSNFLLGEVTCFFKFCMHFNDVAFKAHHKRLDSID